MSQRPRQPAPQLGRRQFLALTSTAVASAALGCRGSEQASLQESPPLEKFRIGYFANATHAQAVLGVSRGAFRGVLGKTELETRVFNAGPSLVEALFAEQIDLGYVGPWPALSGFLRSRGEGLRVVCGAAQNGVSIVARRGSGIRSLEDLRGRRLATPQLGNTQDIAARHFLTKVLGQPDTKNVFCVANAEQVSLMARGEIDAAWVPEPWGERLLREADAVLVAEEKDLWPDKVFSLTVVVATPALIRSHSAVIRGVLGVHRQLTNELGVGSKEVVAELAGALGGLTGRPLASEALAAALGRVRFSDVASRRTFETIAQWAHELELGNGEIDYDRLIDRSFLATG
jgi:NitT/TauT family transport system substrate-binding protein